MNKDKLSRLLKRASEEQSPVPPVDFTWRVTQAIHHGPLLSNTLFDQLNDLFPRLAVAAALVMCLCVITDFYFSAQDGTGLIPGVAQISEDWLFTTKGF